MYSLNPLFVSRKKGAPFTQEQLDQIKLYLEQGLSKKDIRELTGISAEALNRRIKENNWNAAKRRRIGLTQAELNSIKKDLNEGLSVEEVSKKYTISMECLNDRIANNKWTRAKRKTKYTCDETYFDCIDDEHKAYWLGFLMADGYILSKRQRRENSNESQSFGFSISTKDIELFSKFKEDLKSNHPVNIYKNTTTGYKKGAEYGRILITSQHMVDSLKKLGMTENKTFTLKMPDLREDLIRHFIRGYSDGDGSIIISHLASGDVKYYWNITSTKEMCESILVYVGKPELKISQRWPERNNNNWSLKICGTKQVPEILSKIYDGSTIYLERKYKKYAAMQGISV